MNELLNKAKEEREILEKGAQLSLLTPQADQNGLSDDGLKELAAELIRISQDEKHSASGLTLVASLPEPTKMAILKSLASMIDSRYIILTF